MGVINVNGLQKKNVFMGFLLGFSAFYMGLVLFYEWCSGTLECRRHRAADRDILATCARPDHIVVRTPECRKTFTHDWRIRDDLTMQDGRGKRRTRVIGVCAVVNLHLARAPVDAHDEAHVDRHSCARYHAFHVYKNTRGGGEHDTKGTDGADGHAVVHRDRLLG